MKSKKAREYFFDDPREVWQYSDDNEFVIDFEGYSHGCDIAYNEGIDKIKSDVILALRERSLFESYDEHYYDELIDAIFTP